MESPKLFLLYLVIIFFRISKNAVIVEAEANKHGLDLVNEEDFELPMSMSLYEGELGIENRRSLFWHRTFKYYISYGALSANRIPCPPRSGRSYYTHHCFSAHGPAHPYTRGCSAITRCRR
ncbi:PREDICTED: protein RALF-like 34 [Nicotiana attenuata]|uniref:Protein ralf-like 34 n=1 Tax=Nicotiana attenuata TaxID=49451 RepID=A0A314L0A1_NICAT|nr:PREDICTED: protein RALF-like 34 [Nicotiana attenuata]OIT34875.1 protein ralf-like 34 [Nicotiana attenuata]